VLHGHWCSCPMAPHREVLPCSQRRARSLHLRHFEFLDTLNTRLRNSIHNRGLEGVDSQQLLELQPGGQTAHSSDKLRVLNERSNGQGGLSMYVCKLNGDNAQFNWYGNCEGDVDTLAILVRWLISVTNESDAYTRT